MSYDICDATSDLEVRKTDRKLSRTCLYGMSAATGFVGIYTALQIAKQHSAKTNEETIAARTMTYAGVIVTLTLGVIAAQMYRAFRSDSKAIKRLEGIVEEGKQRFGK